LLNGAVAIAMPQDEEIDAAIVDATIQKFADTVRSRVRGSQPQALLAHLHGYLFEEIGFAGNTEDYYAPANSYLPAVLVNRRGLPITLSLVYKLVAERVGIRSWGVGLPGHFLVGIECAGSPMLVDAVTRSQAALHDMLMAIPVLRRNIEHSNAQHHQVVEAILAGDAERARAVMEEHCDATSALLRGLIG